MQGVINIYPDKRINGHMARGYSPTHFYLCLPNQLLERYFKERHNVLHEIKFEKLSYEIFRLILSKG
jgi:hypothetical protein